MKYLSNINACETSNLFSKCRGNQLRTPSTNKKKWIILFDAFPTFRIEFYNLFQSISYNSYF